MVFESGEERRRRERGKGRRRVDKEGGVDSELG